MRIRNKMNLMENMPHYFGVEPPLHLSEIHTIQAIGNTPENNIRTIAALLGVTPSAASQAITRLTKRGLVRKVRGRRNEKEVSLELTEEGMAAFTTHEQIHVQMYEQIAGQIGSLSEADRVIVSRIFSAFESVCDRRIGELSQAAEKRNQARYP
jgi:DNA-binding MarR family transcriptional regulator